METIKQQIQALNGADFAELRRWIFDDEVQRRQALPAVQEAEVALVKDLAAQGEITRPEVATEEAAINGDGIVPAWHNPQGRKSRAYMRGDAVLDEGRIYINRADGLNYARPSAPDSGWEVYNPPKEDETEVPETPQEVPEAPAGPPAWREPANKEELYAKGAEVTHNGMQWRSTVDNNRGEPGTDTSWEETSE
ncbi:hypothetical protein NLL38_03735 [Corynebacterium accolens]|uniref:hypothetical protein n=1 Tax=Corynebacterium accolens TaxID=38284 RepID=UPI0026705407|nr:hypothetical protein [Corynebacterium accolens]WKS69759.1 hypothetical protein NLL40_03725 [Corynebacterium accolens]WKS72036.1 hypothetical protein NLL38_03735 [Corynebacterium accolens]WKS74360.1 hypothetical protein NLL44_04065 [Corynebacterium accolens]